MKIFLGSHSFFAFTTTERKEQIEKAEEKERLQKEKEEKQKKEAEESNLKDKQTSEQAKSSEEEAVEVDNQDTIGLLEDSPSSQVMHIIFGLLRGYIMSDTQANVWIDNVQAKCEMTISFKHSVWWRETKSFMYLCTDVDEGVILILTISF